MNCSIFHGYNTVKFGILTFIMVSVLPVQYQSDIFNSIPIYAGWVKCIQAPPVRNNFSELGPLTLLASIR